MVSLNTEKMYNEISEVALANIYTMSKDTEEIKLKGFNRKDKNHLCIFEIAKTASMLFNFTLTTEANLFDRLWLILKRKGKLSYYKKHLEDGIGMNEFIKYIEKANNHYGIFKEIYEEFYE